MIVALKSRLRLLLLNHVDLSTYVLNLLLLNSIHTLHAKVRRLNISVRSLVDCLAVRDLVLHGGSQATL